MATTPTKKTTPKQPQDHKPKAPPAPEEIEITIGTGDDARKVPGKRVTVAGITIEIADEAFDDFELTIALADMQSGDTVRASQAFPVVFRSLLGDETGRVLRELRDPGSGRVSNETAGGFLRDLFEVLNPNT